MSIVDDILEQFGENSVVLGSEEIDFINTGSISLNASIGTPGIPMGRVTEIFGPEGSAKTTLGLSISKRCILEKKMKVLYIDVEQMLDYNTIEVMLGAPLTIDDGLILSRPSTAEQAFNIAEYGIKSKQFGAIIFDSVGALSPQKEREDDFEDANVALISRMITKFLRRNADSIRNNRVAFVFINQVRDNVGGYIKSFATPGGHALKHFSALRISLYPSEKIKQGNEIIGVNSKFTIAKNKMSSPFKTYYFPVIFGKGVDYFSDLVNFAMELGVIERKGAFYKFNGDTIGKGAIAVMDFLKLKESKPTLDKIEELVYNIVRNHNIVLEKLEEIVESEEKDE